MPANLCDNRHAERQKRGYGGDRGLLGGKLGKGSKRLVLIDTLGNVLASQVVPAHEPDAAMAIAFWDAVAATGTGGAAAGRQLLCWPVY